MYKYCIVPKCSNTTIKTPEKLFFNVPKDPKTRKKWCNIVKRNPKTPYSAKACRHCCEDHFDIEKDMENYVKFKLVGGRLKLKKGVVPHKFDCQNPPKQKIARPGFEKRQRIEYFERVLSKDIEHEDLLVHPIEFVECKDQESSTIQDTDSINISEEIETSPKKHDLSKKNVECKNQDSSTIQDTDSINISEEIETSSKNHDSSKKSQAVQVNMKPKTKNKSCNTPNEWKLCTVKKENNP